MDKKELQATIYQDLKKDYEGVDEIVMEDETVFLVYADDDTLWKIFEDMMNDFTSIEFDAGVGETHFLKIVI